MAERGQKGLAVRRRREQVLTCLSLATLVVVAAYKLAHASLWYDEAVEYWYSKVLVGTLPFEASANMYERIVSTFQPPLYNVVMCAWLTVSDSVWWFRLFGVLMALVCGLGLNRAVRRVSNGYVAAAAVVFLAFTWRMVYYWQECAEYCLMVPMLMWAIWGFVALIQEPTTKHAVLFTVFAVGAAYSQYGALLALFPLVLAAPVHLWRKGHREAVAKLAVSYAVALVVAVLPLVFFFFLPQISHAQHDMGAVPLRDFSPKSFIATLSAVFHYLLIEDVPQVGKYVLLALVGGVVAVASKFDEDGSYRTFLLVNVVTYITYFVAVETGYYTIAYASNPFMERYALFLLPMWLMLFFWAGALVGRACADGRMLAGVDVGRLQKPAVAVLVCGLAVYCGASWTLRLKDNWTKPEDVLGAVEYWYDKQAYDDATFVHAGADASFSYYFRQHPAWNESYEDSVHYMTYYGDSNSDIYADDILSAYPEGLPNRLYVLTSHFDPYLDFFVKAFTQVGYGKPKTVFVGGDTKLYCFAKV